MRVTLTPSPQLLKDNNTMPTMDYNPPPPTQEEKDSASALKKSEANVKKAGGSMAAPAPGQMEYPPQTKADKAAAAQRVGQANATAVEGAITTALAPQQDELGALSGDYSQAMSKLEALPGGGSSDNATLNSATNAVTADLEEGKSGIEGALAGAATAGTNMASNLPYGDVLSSLLTQKKNELIYNTPPSSATSVDTSSWSTGLQGIYNYIQGSSASGGGSGDTGAGPSLAAIEAGAQQATQTGGAPPAGSNVTGNST